MTKNGSLAPDYTEGGLITIAKALAAWDLKVDLSGKDFKWSQRDTTPCLEEFSSTPCLHMPNMSFEDFLNTEIEHFGGSCKIFGLEPPADFDKLEGLFGLAVDIQTVESVNGDLNPGAFSMLANYGITTILDSIVLGPKGQPLQGVFEDRMKSKFMQFPEQSRAVLLGEVSQRGYWEVPEQTLDPDPMVYVYTGIHGGDAAPLDPLYAQGLLFEVFYTKLATGLYIVPKRFLRLRSRNEKDFDSGENGWVRHFVRQNPELEQFYSLCDPPVLGVADVEDGDGSQVQEALLVFMNEMPFIDAVNAARVI